LNVSREGVLLAADTAVEPFTVLAMQILLKDGQRSIHAVGESRWVREAPGGRSHHVGLTFVALATQVAEHWAQAIYTA
jgi:hypothetical protein